MPFAQETPLDDVIKYIKLATVGPVLPEGLPFYVDPVALRRSGRTIDSTVTCRLEGVPLRVTLGLVLKQLDLSYRVKDGLVIVSSPRGDDEIDAFRRVGHCLFALLAGAFGAVAGRVIEGRRRAADSSIGTAARTVT